MSYLGSKVIDNNLTFYVQVKDPITKLPVAADAAPTYRVYKQETATPILTGTMATLDAGNTTGYYSEQIALTALNGFEIGKDYSVRITWAVSGANDAEEHNWQMGMEVSSLSANAITATAIQDNAITANKIATDAISVSKIADGSITAAKFAASAITSTVVANDFITAAKIATGAITSTKFAAGAITASVIATDAIDDDALSDDAFTVIRNAAHAALVLCNLDHLLFTNVAASDVAQGSVIARLVSKTPTVPEWSDYDHTTDSLQAIRDEMVARTLLAANYFDFTTDTVTVGTNNDKTGYALSSAGNAAVATSVEAAILNEGDATALLAAIAAKVEEFLINEGDATATIAAIATAVNSAIVAGQVGTQLGAIHTKLPSKSKLTGTSNADGDIELNEATGSLATDAISAASVSAGAVTKIQTGLSTLTEANIRTAVGLSTNNLDTQLSNIQTQVNTNSNTLTTIAQATTTDIPALISALSGDVTSIKVVTDKVDDTLEDSGGGAWIFTEEALANAPTGGSAPTVQDIVDGMLLVADDFKADVSLLALQSTSVAIAGAVVSILEDTGTTLPGQISGLSIPSASTIASTVVSMSMATIEDTAAEDSLALLVLAQRRFRIDGADLVVYKSDGSVFTTIPNIVSDATADPIVRINAP